MPPLARPFRVIVLDWDGTAVADRDEDASIVRATIERLLCAGVLVVVVTRTSAHNIEGQLSAAIAVRTSRTSASRPTVDPRSSAVREASFRFYEPRTDHGSSLSPPIHAAVAARLGLPDLAMRYFRQTAEIDLADHMGNAAGGVHMAALGGLWQAAVFGFAGLDLAADPPVLRPRLPPSWRRLALAVRWRGRSIDLVANGDAAIAPEERSP